MRELAQAAFALACLVAVVLLAPAVLVFGLLALSRKEWLVKLKRLIEGFLVAVVLASATAVIAHPDFYVECGYWTWPFC